MIPTGLITIDPTVTIYIKLLESIAVRLSREKKVLVINLSTQQTPNLKAALKYINQCALNQTFGAEYDGNLHDQQQVCVEF